jgi:cytochrome c peroxidase
MNKEEFNISYTEVVNRLKQDSGYVQAFRKIFAEEAPHTINEWTINKALAAFVREQGKFDSEFDRYMTGKQKEIAPEVKRGFNLFMGKAKCGTCHFAPTFYGTTPPFFMESESEVLGTLEKWDTLHPVLSADSGRYNFQKNEVYIRSLKTSTVRNIALTAPYMHNGGFPDLESVLDFYNRGGGAGMGLEVSNQTLSAEALNLSQQEISDIIAFMKSLTDKELENLAKGN